MNINDLSKSLPNGFHDSQVHAMTVDFNTCIAEFTLDVWVGTRDDPEQYRRGRLQLLGLEYLTMESPDPGYPYRDPGPIDIDLCEPDEAVTKSRPHADTSFAARFFVSDWNAFVHFAAADARLAWVETGSP